MKEIYKGEDVSDDEAYSFYSKNNKLIPQPDEVKIAEILTDDLDIVRKIFDELDKGADFVELAKQYTLRDGMKSRGGVYDYQPVSKEGEIWKVAANMKIGDVYGPINLLEGFSIIKLLDKREGKREQIESFEEAKNDIKNILELFFLWYKREIRRRSAAPKSRSAVFGEPAHEAAWPGLTVINGLGALKSGYPVSSNGYSFYPRISTGRMSGLTAAGDSHTIRTNPLFF